MVDNAELRGFRSVFVCKTGEQAPGVVALPEITLQNVNFFIKLRSPVGATTFYRVLTLIQNYPGGSSGHQLTSYS